VFAELVPVLRTLDTQEDKEGFGQWTTYWIVASLLAVVERLADVVAAPWLPFYHELKVHTRLQIYHVLPCCVYSNLALAGLCY
jgi:TB2/DP1, HVA22 family